MYRLRRPLLLGALVLPLAFFAGFFLGLPARGQQEGEVSLTCPATGAASGLTRVTVTFSHTQRARLDRHPSLRVTNAEGELVELLPVQLDRRGPAGEGHRDLKTRPYPPGVYQVRAELVYRDGTGAEQSALAAPSPLTVAAR